MTLYTQRRCRRLALVTTLRLFALLTACGGGNGDDTASAAARVEIVQTGLLFTERGQTRKLVA